MNQAVLASANAKQRSQYLQGRPQRNIGLEIISNTGPVSSHKKGGWDGQTPHMSTGATTATAAAGKRPNLQTGRTTTKGAAARNMFDPLFSQHTSKRMNAVTASQANEQRSTLFSGGGAPGLTGGDMSQGDPDHQQIPEQSVADLKSQSQPEINPSQDPI